MRSILIVSFLILMVNLLGCVGYEEPKPEPTYSIPGYYHISEIETSIHDSSRILLADTIEKFNRGERGFEFIPETSITGDSGIYKEFNSGVVTKAGKYLVYPKPSTFMDLGKALRIIIGSDTIVSDIVGMDETHLYLMNEEYTPNSKKIQFIFSEK